ncbi:hypothetical protein ACFFX0_03460 [Citricoccus parietis]|uniref:Uncharacterized protein n=1 Tax=Citricoccus parietis TaxID=592307 RepID=A0ABV5FUD3_9MICC
MTGIALGQGRQLLGELQQQFQPFRVRDGPEVLDDLVELLREFGGGHRGVGFLPE